MKRQKLGMFAASVVAVICIVLLWVVNTNNGYDRSFATEETQTPTSEPTSVAVSEAPAAEATAEPTAVVVTATPTAEPTATPTIKPTEVPTAQPTVAIATRKPTEVPETDEDDDVPVAALTEEGRAEEAEPAPTAPVPTATAAVPTEEPLLYGKIIGIDPGHQAHGNSEKEAVAPGSSEKKAKVSSGTTGRYTGVPEYVTNLEVSLQLRDALEELGATVIMARETHDVDISNQERAIMMNEAGCDLVLRIHCNGSESASANGIGLYIRKTGTGAEACEAAAELLLPAMVEATGAKGNGIYKSDTYTGLNWSEVPCILVEMGFMTNPEEDEKLNDPAYQQLLVEGMVNGVVAYLSDPLE